MRPLRGQKASAEEMDQVRVEGSVLLAFDRSGFVEFDQLVGNAPRFHVWGRCRILRLAFLRHQRPNLAYTRRFRGP